MRPDIRFIGRRVRHDETGKEGVIARHPKAYATRVYVRFDGADFDVPCHPDSIEFVDNDHEHHRTAA